MTRLICIVNCPHLLYISEIAFSHMALGLNARFSVGHQFSITVGYTLRKITSKVENWENWLQWMAQIGSCFPPFSEPFR